MAWTEESISSLRAMWSEGKSASQIAASLGGNITRNAVIGKVHRLALDGRPSPIKGPVKPRVKKEVHGKTLLGMNDRMCKWPIGDPRQPDFHFCSEHAQTGLPYCSEHAAIAYQPARRSNHNHHEDAKIAAAARG
jgi:GcrA cell cycle regulator